jgi:hypothetical protein
MKKKGRKKTQETEDGKKHEKKPGVGYREREKKTKQKQRKKNQRKSQRTPSFAFAFRAQIHRLEKKKERADTGES